MPGARPLEFITAARGRFPRCRVLVYSGHLPDAQIRAQLAGGRCGFLPKPFSSDQLGEFVDELLSRSGGEQLEHTAQ